MAVKYSKWPLNVLTYSILWPSRNYPNWNFWFENRYTIWQPWRAQPWILEEGHFKFLDFGRFSKTLLWTFKY
jgi:hypothetical protein